MLNSEGEPIDYARIIALQPQVDPQLQGEMQVFLKRVSTDCDLMNFYQTYSKCCQHVLERQTAFKMIKVSLISFSVQYLKRNGKVWCLDFDHDYQDDILLLCPYK